MPASKKQPSVSTFQPKAWATEYKDLLTLLVQGVTVAAIIVGAYVFMIRTVNDVEAGVVKLEHKFDTQTGSIEMRLGQRIDTGFSALATGMQVIIERQNNSEQKIKEMREALEAERSERREDIWRQLSKPPAKQ